MTDAQLTKTRIIAGNQQVLRIDHEEKMDISDSTMKQVEEWLLYKLTTEKINFIIISDYEKRLLSKRTLSKGYRINK